MSGFDTTRALAILNRASENGMYDPTKIPESDADKIAAAEQTVQLCRQVEQVVHAAFPGETDERVIAQKVPHWPGVVRTLAEAFVFAGANEPEQEEENLHPATVHGFGSPEHLAAAHIFKVEDAGDTIGHHRTDPTVAPPPEPLGVPQQTPDQEDPKNEVERPVRRIYDSDFTDPQNGEVWLDQRDNAWLIVSYSGGSSAEVKSMISGEATIVPAGFLKRRDRDQEATDEKAPSEMSQEEAAKVEDGLADEPHGLLEEFQRTRQEPSSQPQDPSDEGHDPLSFAPPYAPPPSSQERQHVDEHVSDPDSTDPPPDDIPPSPDDAAIESAKYQDLVETVEERYRPTGMPVPTDLVDPPTLSAEQFADIDDASARILHARFNALAARAKYLHDVEDAISRECDLVRTYHMRRAMAVARKALGKDATVTEVKIVAEEDALVDEWAGYARKHSDEARALKTFHDIYAQHVVVLSRDWSMREAQVR